MSFAEWALATISTTIVATGLIGVVLWLFQSVIVTRLARSVQHEFDAKLEAIRAEIRRSEELLRADLRSKETQIEALRGGALSALASRQATVDKRRLEAVDQLWSAVISLAHFKYASSLMASIRFDRATEEAVKNPRMREVFELFAKPIDQVKLSNDAAKARPYVSEIAWALFSAYQAILMFAVTQIHLLKSGLDGSKLLDMDAVPKLINVALPHYGEYIDKHGPAAYHLLLDELEAGLLRELQKLLEGAESDKATVELAARILKAADSVVTVAQTKTGAG